MITKNLSKLFLLLLILCAAASCGKKAGWQAAEKDQLITSCVTEAKNRAPSLDEGKVKNYCTCYEQNIEKAYPNPSDLTKATVDDMTKAAQGCLDMMK